MKKRICVLGARGFIGSEICRVLKMNTEYDVLEYSLNDRLPRTPISCDILVNAHGNSKKFWAEENPDEDFKISVCSIYDSLRYFDFVDYIYISSIDSKDSGTTYGFHKSIAEDLLRWHLDTLTILRCPAVIGRGMKKGVVYDILNDKPVYLTADSQLVFITNTAIAELVTKAIEAPDNWGVVDIYSKTAITVEKVASILNKVPRYEKVGEKQHYDVDMSAMYLVEDYYPGLKTSEEYVKDCIGAAHV